MNLAQAVYRPVPGLRGTALPVSLEPAFSRVNADPVSVSRRWATSREERDVPLDPTAGAPEKPIQLNEQRVGFWLPLPFFCGRCEVTDTKPVITAAINVTAELLESLYEVMPRSS